MLLHSLTPSYVNPNCTQSFLYPLSLSSNPIYPHSYPCVHVCLPYRVILGMLWHPHPEIQGGQELPENILNV